MSINELENLLITIGKNLYYKNKNNNIKKLNNNNLTDNIKLIYPNINNDFNDNFTQTDLEQNFSNKKIDNYSQTIRKEFNIDVLNFYLLGRS